MNPVNDLALVGKGEAESLFLSLLFLKRYPYLKEVVSDIESQLQSHGAMGTNIGWNGELRHVGSADFDRKFPGLQDKQLLLLLEELSRTRSDKGGGVSKGILGVQTGVFRKEVPEHRAMFKQLSSSYSDLLEKFRNWKISKIQLLNRKYELSLSTNLELPYEDNNNATTIDLTDINTSNNAQSSSSAGASQMQLTLQNIGRGKLTNQTDAELASAEIAMQVIATEDLPMVANQLKNGGFLGCKIQEGMIFNMPQYLLGRKAGLFRSATSKLGTTLQIGTHDIRTKIHLNYRKQYTISGHMMNPAYCSVFDQTGNFLLTGADDYLVKIWDVNKGILVKSCKGHIAYVSLIVVSVDNSFFASSCTSGSIRIWRMKDGVCLHVLLHKATVNWMKFDTATSALASGSDDGQCMIWDLSRILAPNAVESPLLNEIVKDRKHKWEISHEADYNALDADDILSMEIHHRCGAMRGLFEWSRPVEQSPVENNNVLVLTQIRDPQNYTPQSEPLRILCLDVSSLGGVVITGCEDGVARIWRYDTADTPGNQYPQRTSFRRHNENRKGMLSSNQYAMLERIEKHLLLRLEGHVAPITDVQFNSLGDRVVTGSAQDGSVRIWSLSRKYNDSVHLILDLAEEDDVGQPIVPSSRSRRQAPGLHPKLKVRVHNVCWTADDLRVVTIQSVAGSESSNGHELNKSTRLKVWDSMTGDLLRIIWSVSEKASKCLIRHPFDSHIVITAGEDGFVSVWNIELESNVCKLAVLNDDSTPANLVDLSITHDGRRIAATDVLGRLTVFSLDNPEKFHNFMYHEQYFSTDYTDILLDVNGYAVDIGTQMPVHEAPVGLLCRIDGSAYDIQPPCLSGPEPTSREEAQAVLKRLNEDRIAQPVEMDRVYDIFVKNKRTNRLATRYRSSRIKSTSNNASTNRGNKNWNSNPNQRESRVNYIDFDINQYVPSSDESNDSEFEGMEVADDDEQQPVSMNRHFYRLRRSSAQRSSGGVGVSNLRSRSSNRRDTAAANTNAFDEEGEEGNPVRIHNGTTRAERAALRAQRWGGSGRRSGRTFNVDDDEDEISLDFMDEEEDDQRIGLAMYKRGGQRRKSKRTASRSSRSRSSAAISLIDSDDDDDQQLRFESTSLPRAPSERRQRRNGPTWKQDSKGNRSVPIGIELDRKWLQPDMQLDMTYVPQVGDSVIYSPQGHQEYLLYFPENTSPPWVHFSTQWPFVACEVRDMKYVLPTERDYAYCKSVLVVLTLALVGVPIANTVRSTIYTATFVEPRTSRHSTHQQEHLFTVTIRNAHHADFLVPRVLFDRALTLQFTPGMRVLVYFRDDNGAFLEFQGSIVKLSNKTTDWPNSPWEVVTLVFDNDEATGLSPLLEEDGLDLPDNIKQAESRVSLWEINPERNTSSAVVSRFYTSKLPTLNLEESQRIANEMERLVESDARYSVFQFEPDPEMYDDYWCYIAVPITTDLIVRRLRNLYYRQKAQLDHDIDQLVDNCCLYNKPNADISQDAKELRELIRRIVYPDSFPDEEATGPVDDMYVGDHDDNDYGFDLGFSFEGKSGRSKRAKPSKAESSKTAFDDSDSQDELPRSKRRRLQPQQTAEPSLSFKLSSIRSNRRSAKAESSDDEEEEEAPRRRSSRRGSKAKDESSDENSEEEEDEDSPPAKSRTTRRSATLRNRDSSSLKIVLNRGPSQQQASSKTSARPTRGRNVPDEEKEDESEENEYVDNQEEEEQHQRPRRRFSQRAVPQLKPRATQSSRPRRQSSKGINYAAFDQDSDVMEESEAEDDQLPARSSRGLTLNLRRSTRTKAAAEEEKEEKDSESSAESSEPKGLVGGSVPRRPQSQPVASSKKANSNAFDDEEDSDDNENDTTSGSRYFKESPVPVAAALRSRQLQQAQQPAAMSRSSRPVRRTEINVDEDSVLPTRSTRSGLPLEADQSSNNVRRSMGTRRVASNFNVTAQEHQRQHQQMQQSPTTTSPSRRRLTPEEKKVASSLVDYATHIDQQRHIFAEPALPTLANYYEIVIDPSDLSTIRGSIRAGDVRSVSEVIGDILRMYDNCELYHDPGSKEVREAKSQRRQFLNHLKQRGLSAPTPEGIR